MQFLWFPNRDTLSVLPIEQQFAKIRPNKCEKVIEQQLPRKLNRDTTKGMELQQQITQLKRLLDYRKDD